MIKGKDGWIIGLGILLVVSIGLNFYLYNNQAEAPEEKALLDVQIYQWAENLYDSSEMFFDYWIYNYGEVEAKNVRVNCKLFDKYDNERSSVIDYYGNLASKSGEFGEVITADIRASDNEEFSPICYVESCDNCEILYKRIPKLIESYE